jgi:hypothetical protein
MYYFKYSAADWVKENGFPHHHLRIIARHVDNHGQRWYTIFDTTLKRGHADYDWRWADVLEANSELVKSAENVDHARAILQRCAKLRYWAYSVLQRTDCESLQGYIQTAKEEDRWCPQLWKTIGVVLSGSLLVAAINNHQQEQQRNTASRKRSVRRRRYTS